MKKILATVLILLFCFTGISFAQQFCENPFGMKFFTERNLAEAIASKQFGSAFKRDENSTFWSKDKGLFNTLFFKDNKLVAASTMIIIPLNVENVKIIMELFQDSVKTINKGNQFIQEKQINDSFQTVVLRGIKFNCKHNEIEHAVLYVAKDETADLLSMNLYIYLSGFGFKEF